jgi:alpha-galactosidase
MTIGTFDRRRAVLTLLAGISSFALPRRGRATVAHDERHKSFRLDGGGVTYAFAVKGLGQLQSLHWGGALGMDDPLILPSAPPEYAAIDFAVNLTPLEYVGFGGGLDIEPSLKVSYPDGVRDVELRYVGHTLRENGITVLLKDISRELYVELRFGMDEATGVLSRSAVVENRTRDWVQIEQIASATLNLPRADDYQLHYLTGRWAAEWEPQTRAITAGATVLESRQGSTGQQMNPWLAISRSRLDGAGDSDGESGPVWFGALAWSGSWRISIETPVVGGVRVTAGYNPFDFAYRLGPGEKLDTPAFHAGFSSDGMGGASRTMHRFQRTRVLPGAPTPRLRPVLYNSWYATEFAVDENGQKALANIAAGLGVERFVVDDGWFGKRNNDHAGLGDWTVNPQKFPAGLGPLIATVRGLGMDFGLWVEPEMVNADSDLYRSHPDWVISFRGRPRTLSRNQMVLNLARTDVRDYLVAKLELLLRENAISFLKWDHNRNWSEPGWEARAPADEQRMYVDYVVNLYWILAELRRRFPKLEIESCAGGGGRVDLGIMTLTEQVWPSDNTDPFDRLRIQDGFSYAYSPGVMMAWVTDSPSWVNQRSTSLEYRFLSSMQGCLGLGANLNNWQSAEFAMAKRLIAEYKTIRPTIQQGDLYRLVSPQGNSGHSATLSVSPDRKQAAMFVFLHSSQNFAAMPLIPLRGLDSRRRYGMRAFCGKPDDATPSVASGAYWMEHGIAAALRGDFQCAGFVFEALS